MSGAWWRWVTAADEPPPQPEFDPSNLTAEIRAALDDDNPSTVIRERWPWVPRPVRVAFLVRVLIAPDDDGEDELVERFRQAVIAHHTPARRWLRRKRSH